MRNTFIFTIFMSLICVSCGCNGTEKPVDPVVVPTTDILYTMPEESEPHEGTWLQWPHEFQYDLTYRNRMDATWAAMTKALESSEKVHIVAYNDAAKTRIIGLLNTEGVSLANVDFKIYPTDDVWVRDNGPIYAKDKDGKLVIEDWGFQRLG